LSFFGFNQVEYVVGSGTTSPFNFGLNNLSKKEEKRLGSYEIILSKKMKRSDWLTLEEVPISL